jgi:hypothetical protein
VVGITRVNEKGGGKSRKMVLAPHCLSSSEGSVAQVVQLDEKASADLDVGNTRTAIAFYS